MVDKNPKTQTDVIASPKESLKSDVNASPILPHVSENDSLISDVNQFCRKFLTLHLA